MFGTIRKHQNWLWGVIITVIIISFVVYFSPYSKLHEGGKVELGSIAGQPITELAYIQARREADLHSFFTTGRWMDENQRSSQTDTDRQVYQWLVLAQRQKALNLNISDDLASRVAWQLIRPFERMGISSPAVFVQQVLPKRGLTVADFERFVRHFVGIQELISVAGVNGRVVTPQEVKSLYEREHQEVSTEAVFFLATNYLGTVTVVPEALNQFYTNRQAYYRIPERIQVSYVRFNVTNLLAKAEAQLTNLTQNVDDNMQRMGTNYTRFGKTLEEAKVNLRERIIREQAMGNAKKEGLEFATILFDTTNTPIAELAKSKGLTVGVTAPFTRDEGPQDIEGGVDFGKKAFELTAQEPVGGPIMGDDGAYVIKLDKTIPSEVPPLSQIQARVEGDFKHVQAMMKAQTEGMAFYQKLTNGLAQGKKFSEICTEAKQKVVELPPFSLATRSLEALENLASLDQVKQAAFGVQPGHVSQLMRANDGGMLIHVKAKLPIDQAKAAVDLPAYTESLRRNKQQEAFNSWFSKEFTKELRDGLRNTSLAQPQRPPPSMSTPAPAPAPAAKKS